MPEERAIIFAWLFLDSAGAESVSANDDQVEIPVLRSNPRKASSLAVAIRSLKPMSAAVRGSVEKSRHQ